MIKMIRQMKLMTYILLNKKQKLLLKFQKKNVLDSETDSSSDSDNEDIDPIKMLHHKNQKIGKLFSEKLKDTLESYEAKNLKDIDKKLLRGLNEKQHFDHDEGKDKIMLVIKKYILMKMEEIRESMGNDTLMGGDASYK